MHRWSDTRMVCHISDRYPIFEAVEQPLNFKFRPLWLPMPFRVQWLQPFSGYLQLSLAASAMP